MSDPHGGQTVVQQTFRQGPIPAPRELADYDDLLPGTASRIIAMAEREQAHRMNQEDMLHRSDIRHRDEVVAAQREVARGTLISTMLGQTLGWLIAGGALAGAVFTAYIGAHPTVSIALVGLPIASIIKAMRVKDGGKPPS